MRYANSFARLRIQLVKFSVKPPLLRLWSLACLPRQFSGRPFSSTRSSTQFVRRPKRRATQRASKRARKSFKPWGAPRLPRRAPRPPGKPFLSPARGTEGVHPKDSTRQHQAHRSTRQHQAQRSHSESDRWIEVSHPCLAQLDFANDNFTVSTLSLAECRAKAEISHFTYRLSLCQRGMCLHQS